MYIVASDTLLCQTLSSIKIVKMVGYSRKIIDKLFFNSITRLYYYSQQLFPCHQYITVLQVHSLSKKTTILRT